MRLIDADALMGLLKAWQYEAQRLGAEINNRFATAIIAQVNAMPTIEPERKTGTWCVTPNGKLVCSNCYKNPTNRIIVDGSVIYDMTPIKQRMKFCPNCGSYNGGEEHEID